MFLPLMSFLYSEKLLSELTLYSLQLMLGAVCQLVLHVLHASQYQSEKCVKKCKIHVCPISKTCCIKAIPYLEFKIEMANVFKS